MAQESPEPDLVMGRVADRNIGFSPVPEIAAPSPNEAQQLQLRRSSEQRFAAIKRSASARYALRQKQRVER